MSGDHYHEKMKREVSETVVLIEGWSTSPVLKPEGCSASSSCVKAWGVVYFLLLCSSLRGGLPLLCSSLRGGLLPPLVFKPGSATSGLDEGWMKVVVFRRCPQMFLQRCFMGPVLFAASLKSGQNCKMGSGGLSAGWSLIRAVFHQDGLSSGWSLIRMVFHQCGLSSGWSLIRVIPHQGGLSSGWSLLRMVFHQRGLSSGWPLIRVIPHQGGLLSEWSVIRMVPHQGGPSSGWWSRVCGLTIT